MLENFERMQWVVIFPFSPGGDVQHRQEKALDSLVRARAGPSGRRDMALAMSAVEKAQC